MPDYSAIKRAVRRELVSVVRLLKEDYRRVLESDAVDIQELEKYLAGLLSVEDLLRKGAISKPGQSSLPASKQKKRRSEKQLDANREKVDAAIAKYSFGDEFTAYDIARRIGLDAPAVGAYLHHAYLHHSRLHLTKVGRGPRGNIYKKSRSLSVKGLRKLIKLAYDREEYDAQRISIQTGYSPRSVGGHLAYMRNTGEIK